MTTRIGLIGAGNIGAQHGRVLASLPGVEVAAVVDVDEARASDLAAEFGANGFGTVSEALSHMDAAYVLTPPRQRLDVIRTIAEAGKPIFCEKPLAASVADGEAIRNVVRETGVPFMMGFMRRYAPTMVRVKDVLNSGALGEIVQVSLQRLEKQVAPAGNWRIAPESLVGMAVESVSHDIDLLRWLVGDIARADGHVRNSSGLQGFNDDLAATLKFENGAIGTLQVSWNSWLGLNTLGILGTSGALMIDGQGVWTFDRMRTSLAGGEQRSDEVIAEDEARDIGMTAESETFMAILNGGDVEYPGVDDGLATLVISNAITASHAGATQPA